MVSSYFWTMIGPVKRLFSAILLLTLFEFSSFGQNLIIRGIIRDEHSDERIPFASMKFKNSGLGRLSDSAGGFIFRFTEWPVNDTLEITYVGYQDYKLAIDSLLLNRVRNNTLDLNIRLVRGKYTTEVVIRRKVDWGLVVWRRIVKRKPFNDRYRFDNFSYELYNKLEVDIKNVNKNKWKNLPVLKKFGFVFDNIDTTDEGTPYLPVYLTEALSNYYYQKSPKRRREVFKGTKTMGVNNESALKFIGGMDQNINFYNNFLPVMDKLFVSPISDNGDNYYRYRILDTQFVDNRRLFHIMFTPKRKGENTFEGDCWVHDTTWAIQKMNLRLSKDANINYVDKLSMIQEYKMINDSTWFLSRDKFVADMSFSGEKTLSAIGRKSTTYENVIVNDSSVIREIDKNKLSEETILPDSAKFVTDSFWVQERHEPLNKNEQAIYTTIDTLLKMPAFKRTTRMLDFLVTGYLNVGNYQIGPWQNWVNANVYEGLRLRWDLGTNRFFNKKLILHGYLAYGFKDDKLKGKADVLWILKKNPRMSLFASYTKDFDRSQSYYDEISQDNIFALAIRKSGIPIKFLKIEETKLDFFKEWHSGLSVTLTGMYKKFDPLMNLPPKELFNGVKGEPLTTFETSIRFRFAYLEKFLD